MSARNPHAKKLIDRYIAKQRPFAVAICKELRRIVHTADPKIQEDWKWGPNFQHEGMVCGIGGFQSHVTFWFYNGAAMKDSKKLFNYGKGNFRTRSIKIMDVAFVRKNRAALIAYVREAVQNNLKGKKPPKPHRRPAHVMPPDVRKELQKHDLLDAYNARPFYQRNDYLMWFAEAKRPETRTKRIEQMLEDLRDGRTYMGLAIK